MIGQETIQDIVNRIVEVANPTKIFLFGSYAEGTQNEDSDLDILVIQETEQPSVKRTIPIRLRLWGIGVPVDLLVWTTKEYDHRKDNPYSVGYQIQKKGKLLYERN